MGVQGLWDLASPAGQRIKLSALEGKVVAVDASIWLYHFLKAMRDDKGNMIKGAHVIGFFRRICKLLYLKIKPVFVFDGPPPALKRRTLRLRAQQRENEERQRKKVVEKLLRNQLKTHILGAAAAVAAEGGEVGGPVPDSNVEVAAPSDAQAASSVGDDCGVRDEEAQPQLGAEDLNDAASASSSGAEEVSTDEPPQGGRRWERWRRGNVPQAFRGFVSKRRTLNEVTLPELPQEPLRDLLGVPDRSRITGRMREPDEWKGYTLPDGTTVTIPLDGPVSLEEFQTLSPKTKYSLLQRAQDAWYNEARLKAVEARDDMGSFCNVQLETFMRTVRMHKEIERVKKAMAEEVTRPVGDGLAEGDVYVPPDWLRTGGAGEPERSQGSDVATGTKATDRPPWTREGGAGRDGGKGRGRGKGRRDEVGIRQLGGHELEKLQPILDPIWKEIESGGAAAKTKSQESPPPTPCSSESAARDFSDREEAEDLFGAAFFQDDADEEDGHSARAAGDVRDCVLPDTREVEDVLGAAFFQDDESAIASDGVREGLGADDARAVRQERGMWRGRQADAQVPVPTSTEGGYDLCNLGGFITETEPVAALSVQAAGSCNLGGFITESEPVAAPSNKAADFCNLGGFIAETEPVAAPSGQAADCCNLSGFITDTEPVAAPSMQAADSCNLGGFITETEPVAAPSEAADSCILGGFITETEPVAAPSVQAADSCNLGGFISDLELRPELPRQAVDANQAHASGSSPTRPTGHWPDYQDAPVGGMVVEEAGDEVLRAAFPSASPATVDGVKTPVESDLLVASSPSPVNVPDVSADELGCNRSCSEATVGENAKAHDVEEESLDEGVVDEMIKISDRVDVSGVQGECVGREHIDKAGADDADLDVASPGQPPAAAGVLDVEESKDPPVSGDGEDPASPQLQLATSPSAGKVRSPATAEATAAAAAKAMAKPAKMPWGVKDTTWCGKHFQYRWRCQLDGVDGECTKVGCEDTRQGAHSNTSPSIPQQAADSADVLHAADTALGDEDMENLEFQSMQENLAEERQGLDDELRRAKTRADTVTTEMRTDVEALLKAFGIPFVRAASEAEAQCTFLAQQNLVDAVATDDSDVLVFGAGEVYRKLFSEDQMVECYTSRRIESHLGLAQGDLIVLAMLLGCDYTLGVHGIGIVNGLEIVQAYMPHEGGSRVVDRENLTRMWLDELQKLKAWSSNVAGWGHGDAGVESTDRRPVADFKHSHKNFRTQWSFPEDFPNPDVYGAFVRPEVDRSLEPFAWAPVDIPSVAALLQGVTGLSEEKIRERLEPAVNRYSEALRQPRITEYMVPTTGDVAVVRSGRLLNALRGIRGMVSTEEDGSPARKRRRRKKDEPMNAAVGGGGVQQADSAKPQKPRARRKRATVPEDSSATGVAEPAPKRGRVPAPAKPAGWASLRPQADTIYLEDDDD